MNHARHAYPFSRGWFVLHRDWVVKFKRYGPTLGLGALLAIAALLIWNIYATLDVPVMDAGAMSAVAEELFMSTGLSSYLQPRF